MTEVRNSGPSTTHVCLVSDQPIPNLLPLLIEKPRQAIFLVSPEKAAQAERLKKVMQPRGINVTMREISAYDFDAVAGICEQLLADTLEPDLTLNVTGGTKIAALAAFQVFFFANRRIIYCDTEHNRLLQLAPQRDETLISGNAVGVRDYLACYGVPRVEGGQPPPGGEERSPHLAALAGLLVHEERLLANLNSALERQEKKNFANLSLNELGQGAEKLIDLLKTCGVAGLTGTNNLNIPSADKIFFCKGGWLEEHVYWSVKNLGIKALDLTMNVKVQWDGKGKQRTKNEFDVLFTHHNRLHIISCKASNPERETGSGTRATEALNELDSLADRAGGLFGRAMLVSAR